MRQPASKPHFNIRDSNLDTGHVDGTHGHYTF
ncbi:TPA: HNH/endonuclease VII fold putative polymorphic toxin [Neisseria gonorrhoeae]